jgi:hypothetical protein
LTDTPGQHFRGAGLPSPRGIAVRVASGTAVFTAVLWLASRYPTAAGLMLTFPMLNGFAFIYSRREDVAAATSPMLWMPLLNAAVCVAYMSAFIALAGRAPAAVLAWSIAAGAALLWLAMARSQRVRRGVATAWQWHYVAAVPIAGALLTLAWWIGFAGMDAAPVAAPSALQWYKVALFAVALVLLIVLPSLLGWGPGARGILSGLPLVSLGGLLGIALDDAIVLEARRALFGEMMLGVWLSPSIAVAYIFGVSRVIARPRAYDRRVGVVVVGWVLCGLTIAVTAAALRLLAAADGFAWPELGASPRHA